MIRNLFTTSEVSTINTVDILGDGSGIALFRFENNTNDDSGNFNATPTGITYTGGVFGQCAVFNGSAYAVISNLIIGSSSFTYAFRIYPTSVNGQAYYNIIDSTNNRAIVSYGSSTSGYLTYYDGGAYRYFGTYTLPVNTWTSVIVSISGTTANLYINGTFNTSVAVTQITPSGLTAIGSNYPTSGSRLNGRLDQFRILNKAVNATEAMIIYNELK